MAAEIQRFYDDLALDTLRIVRPTKFLFLCGGAIEKDKLKAPAINLRDYLWRVRPLSLAYPTVLAEEAVQLFRDSDYHDLISFEEDIARIAAIVIVIAESAGSLAELGAFASNDVIRRVLRVLVQDTHAKAESFVRWGPIHRLSRSRRDLLGVYPWKVKPDGLLNVSSTKPHYDFMKSFISDHLDKIPTTFQYIFMEEERVFYIIYWLVFICKAVSFETLLSYIGSIGLNLQHSELRRKIYCLRLAKWIAVEAYSGKDYYYTLSDIDSFEYSFKASVKEKKVVRRKLEVYNAHLRIDPIPAHVRLLAAKARKASAS